MKITKSYIKKVIQEELEEAFNNPNKQVVRLGKDTYEVELDGGELVSVTLVVEYEDETDRISIDRNKNQTIWNMIDQKLSSDAAEISASEKFD